MLRTFTCSWTLSSLDVVVPRGLLHNPRTASISDRNARSGSCLSMCVWHLVMVLVWWVPYSEVLSQWAELQPKQQRPGATLMHFILVRPQGMICMMWSGEGRGGGGGIEGGGEQYLFFLLLHLSSHFYSSLIPHVHPHELVRFHVIKLTGSALVFCAADRSVTVSLDSPWDPNRLQLLDKKILCYMQIIPPFFY